MKTISIVFILAIYAALSSGSVKITGTVKNSDGERLHGVSVKVKGTTDKTVTDAMGVFAFTTNKADARLVFSLPGYLTYELTPDSYKDLKIVLRKEHELDSSLKEIDVNLDIDIVEVADEEVISDYTVVEEIAIAAVPRSRFMHKQLTDQEEYTKIEESGYQTPVKSPLSTFSIDVDAASYANVRRFLSNGQTPPPDAVRIEEMVNYFRYDYESPKGKQPFTIVTEVGESPWNEGHKLVHIGLQGRKIDTKDLPASNLVFLIDVSGSMNSPDKLPLLKSSMKMLTNQLRGKDKVAIVVYAGAAGVVLKPTAGDQTREIHAAIDKLSAGGSTAGGEGIELAYALAEEHFAEGGNNRVILATDGDFNVGISDVGSLENLIEEKRETGVYLTVLGFGSGNIKDNKMETLADKGNGNYAYIDTILEARKVLVEEIGGTLFTIARDVKIQVEFNPATVQAYRLVGYENRMMNNEDFNDDKKDAGELGAGHTVTALYEIIPVGVKSKAYDIDPLKYQQAEQLKETYGDELLTVKLRYKDPEGEESKLLTRVVENSDRDVNQSSNNFRWSAAVAGFAMDLRKSDYLGLDYNLASMIELAESARGDDAAGYRSEFIRLMKTWESL